MAMIALRMPEAGRRIEMSVGGPTVDEHVGINPGSFSQRIAEAWSVCEDLFADVVVPSGNATEGGLLNEMIFCLLGGHGITYELNLSATEKVVELEPFHSAWSQRDLGERLTHELSLRQFLPRVADGRLRRYRFPNAATRALLRAREWALEIGPNRIITRLESTRDERARRRLLCECPGIGPKKATWILRNIGLASTLAIVDVHVLRALQHAGFVVDLRMPRDYEQAEDAFLGWCTRLGASPAAFDLFLWEWQRGSLTT